MKDTQGVFVNFFNDTGEIYIVVENETKYFNFHDTSPEYLVTPQITQLALVDFGLSYAIRLSDGRFIVIDGGRELENDIDNLYSVLKQGSPYKKPIIAAWILSHPHSDHFHAFHAFVGKYENDVEIYKVFYNFPERDNFERFPSLNFDEEGFEWDTSPFANIPLMFDAINKCGAEVFEVHTGQIFKIGVSVLEIMASLDDTLHTDNKNLNAASLVIRMELGGQVILWTTDAPCSHTQLAEKYGDYLKSHILQVPHHGFQSGSAEAEISCYKLIKPAVCLLPAADYTAYTSFCTYRKGTNYLFTESDVEEILTGDKNHTLTLPYTPKENAKQIYKEKYVKGREKAGKTVWKLQKIGENSIITATNKTVVEVNIGVYCNCMEIHRFTVPRLKTVNVNLNEFELNCDDLEFKGDIPIIISFKE